MILLKLLGPIFMGWSLGSNDSANVFGTAVESQAIRHRNAVILCSLFVIIGAFIGGTKGIKTLSGILSQNINTALIITIAGALTVTIMTFLNMPVSTSQAVVGAIIGIGISSNEPINFSQIPKIIIVWIGTPTATIIITCILYIIFKKLFNLIKVDIFAQDYMIKICLIIAGCYGSYALGANNVANVTGVYANIGILTVFTAALLGGISIALGVITYSKKVMMTVGSKLVKLDTFSAFIAVLSHAIVLDIFARIGVPTSSSQAIVGGVLGIGIVKGVQTINIKTIISIIISWITTPIIAFIFSFTFYKIFFYFR